MSSNDAKITRGGGRPEDKPGRLPKPAGFKILEPRPADVMKAERAAADDARAKRRADCEAVAAKNCKAREADGKARVKANAERLKAAKPAAKKAAERAEAFAVHLAKATDERNAAKARHEATRSDEREAIASGKPKAIADARLAREQAAGDVAREEDEHCEATAAHREAVAAHQSAQIELETAEREVAGDKAAAAADLSKFYDAARPMIVKIMDARAELEALVGELEVLQAEHVEHANVARAVGRDVMVPSKTQIAAPVLALALEAEPGLIRFVNSIVRGHGTSPFASGYRAAFLGGAFFSALEKARRVDVPAAEDAQTRADLDHMAGAKCSAELLAYEKRRQIERQAADVPVEVLERQPRPAGLFTRKKGSPAKTAAAVAATAGGLVAGVASALGLGGVLG